MTAKLGTSDYMELTEFLKRHMTMEQRVKLMSGYPLLYKKLYPQAMDDAIISHVRRALDEQG